MAEETPKNEPKPGVVVQQTTGKNPIPNIPLQTVVKTHEGQSELRDLHSPPLPDRKEMVNTPPPRKADKD